MRHPEDDGVDIDRHRVSGERLLGIDGGGLDALVDPCGDGVEDGNDEEKAGARDRVELAGAQYDGLFPLPRHLEPIGDDEADEEQGTGRHRRPGDGEADGRQSGEDDEQGEADGVHGRSCAYGSDFFSARRRSVRASSAGSMPCDCAEAIA